MDCVYDTILLPILEAAKASGEIQSFPTCRFAIDTAFAIPAKNGTNCPVVVRLASLYLRNLVFRLKKDTLPKQFNSTTNKDRPLYSIFEDLTPANFRLLGTFKGDERVKSAWTYNGQVKFRLLDDDTTIYKVKNLTDTVDSVLASQPKASPTNTRPLTRSSSTASAAIPI